MRVIASLRPFFASIFFLVVLATSACGGDDFPREDFLEEMSRVSPELPQAQVECLYDKIDADQSLKDAIKNEGIDNPTAETREKLTDALAECIVASKTTSPPDNTTEQSSNQ